MNQDEKYDQWINTFFDAYVKYMIENHFDLFNKFDKLTLINPPQKYGETPLIFEPANIPKPDYDRIIEITNAFHKDYLNHL